MGEKLPADFTTDSVGDTKLAHCKIVACFKCDFGFSYITYVLPAKFCQNVANVTAHLASN